jgi:hypothetical protein
MPGWSNVVAVSFFSANVHSRLLEALAQASPTPAEE